MDRPTQERPTRGKVHSMESIPPEDLRQQHASEAVAWISGLPGDTFLSHWSSAIVCGLPTLDVPARLMATRPPRRRAFRDDRHNILRAALRARDVTTIEPARVTSGARTAVDLARWVSFEGAMITADAALRARLTTRVRLEDVLRHQWVWPRIRRAVPVVRYASPLSESPLESYIRARIIRLRLPMPRQQVSFGMTNGQGRASTSTGTSRGSSARLMDS